MAIKTPFLNKVVIFLIVGIRPLFGVAHCRFAISCTRFAAIELQDKPLMSAVWSIVNRVVACNPLW